MPVSKLFLEATAETILHEFENLLCDNDIKLNNMNPKENEFETEQYYIKEKDYKKLKEKIIEQLKDIEEYSEKNRAA